MSPVERFFFNDCPEALPLYEAFMEKVFAEIEPVRIQVKKTQISLLNRHLFACVSRMRVRRAALMPPVYIVVTFGLGVRINSPRISAATEPYPGRWTHHVLITSVTEIDEELMDWVSQAYAFAAIKPKQKL